MKHLWRIGLLAAGLSIFAWYVARAGLDHVWETIQRLGPMAPLILLPYLLVYLVDCLGWAQTLPARGISFLSLLKIRWAGESVNNVLPSAYVGGEAVKVCLLRAAGVTAAEGTTAAVISKTAQTIAQFAFVLAGSALLIVLAQERAGLRWGVLSLVLCGLIAMAALFWVQKSGLFRMLFSLLGAIRCRVPFLEHRKPELLQLDQTIASFYARYPRRFSASIALYFGGWLMDSFEIYLVAHLLGMPIAWSQAIVVEAFTGVAKALGMWVPGSLGVQESGIVLMGRLLGLPDTLTASYALIRRGRELVFAAAGLLLLYSDDPLRNTLKAKPVIQ